MLINPGLSWAHIMTRAVMLTEIRLQQINCSLYPGQMMVHRVLLYCLASLLPCLKIFLLTSGWSFSMPKTTAASRAGTGFLAPVPLPKKSKSSPAPKSVSAGAAGRGGHGHRERERAPRGDLRGERGRRARAGRPLQVTAVSGERRAFHRIMLQVRPGE